VPPPLTSTSACVAASASRKSPACAACSQGSPTTRDPQRADPSISAAAIARRYGTKSVDLRTTHAVPFVAIQATSASRDGGGLAGSGSGGGPTGCPAVASRLGKDLEMNRVQSTF